MAWHSLTSRLHIKHSHPCTLHPCTPAPPASRHRAVCGRFSDCSSSAQRTEPLFGSQTQYRVASSAQMLPLFTSALGLVMCTNYTNYTNYTHTSYMYYSLLPTPYSLLPTPYSLLPTPYSLLPTPYSVRPAPCSLLPAPCTLHPTPYSLLSAAYLFSLLPAPPCSLLPAP